MVELSALFGLEGRRALVTGGTSGIGRAVAELFLAAGAQVVVNSHDGTCAHAPTGAQFIQRTLGTARASTGLIEDASDTLGGPLDILVSNAGAEGPLGPLGPAQEEQMRTVFDVNLHAATWLAEAAAPGMARAGGGAMIFTASIAGLRGNAQIGAYAMTKAALLQLARNAAVRWGPDNIRANAIAPGLIETSFSRGLMEQDAFMARRIAATPLRRVGQPEEIAAAALWLAGPGGAFTTGQTIVVDGGTLISDGS